MLTPDELGKRLRDARSDIDDICDCGSVHGYVDAAGNAWKGGVINTAEYADALALAWDAVRRHYLKDRPQPTIAELDAILSSDGNGAVTIQPDGSITVLPR